MKNTVNSILKLVLVVTFCCTAAIADGDMTNGGRSCTGAACPSFAGGGSAGKTGSDDSTKPDSDVFKSNESENSISDFVKGFLAEIGLI